MMAIQNLAKACDFQKKRQSDLSDLLYFILKTYSRDILSLSQREFRFHPSRKWRFDFAWPQKKVAVECDGIAYQAGGGRHNTDSDREKLNAAASLGWRVLRFSGKQLRDSPLECISYISNSLIYQ